MTVYNGVPFTLVIYNSMSYADYDNAGFVKLVEDGSYQTEITGGFGTMSVEIYTKPEYAYQWFTLALGKRCRLYSSDGSIVHEGRIERTNMTKNGFKVDSLGLYTLGNDVLMGLVYPTSTPTSASEVVSDAVALVDEWREGRHAATTTDITPLDFFGDVKVNKAITEVLKYGDDDTPPHPLHFQVWEMGITKLLVELTGESLASAIPQYIIKLDNTKDTSTYTSTLSSEKVYNKIQAIFDDPDIGQTFTDPFLEDADSQKRFGVRVGTINVGQSSEGVADLAAEIALEAYKDPELTRGVTIKVAQNKIVSGNGKPLHLMRAGQLILLDEATPYGVTGINDPVGRQAASTKAVVARTSYNIKTGTMTITPGTRTRTFDLLMAQLGISGVGIS